MVAFEDESRDHWALLLPNNTAIRKKGRKLASPTSPKQPISRDERVSEEPAGMEAAESIQIKHEASTTAKRVVNSQELGQLAVELADRRY